MHWGVFFIYVFLTMFFFFKIKDFVFYGVQINVCCLLFPYAHTKLEKIQKIIDHYDGVIMNTKVVDLDEYKKSMSLEWEM